MPGFLRRMGAVIYDALLLLAVMFFATALALEVNGGLPPNDNTGLLLYRWYLILVSLLFYVGFWTHGGQTLGMRAWKFKVCDMKYANIGWGRAAGRFVAAVLSWACLGLGFLWCLFDREQLSWHDRLSGTRLIMVGREKDGPKK